MVQAARVIEARVQTVNITEVYNQHTGGLTAPQNKLGGRNSRALLLHSCVKSGLRLYEAEERAQLLVVTKDVYTIHCSGLVAALLPKRAPLASLTVHPPQTTVARLVFPLGNHVVTIPRPEVFFGFHECGYLGLYVSVGTPQSSSVAGGGPTGSTIPSMQCRRTASTLVPIPTLM